MVKKKEEIKKQESTEPWILILQVESTQHFDIDWLDILIDQILTFGQNPNVSFEAEIKLCKFCAPVNHLDIELFVGFFQRTAGLLTHPFLRQAI